MSEARPAKLEGYALWEAMGRPRRVMAPMVDASELPFRMLSRKLGTQLCYSPMMNSRQFVMSDKYRQQNWHTCKEDRPLIAQVRASRGVAPAARSAPHAPPARPSSVETTPTRCWKPPATCSATSTPST